MQPTLEIRYDVSVCVRVCTTAIYLHKYHT